MASCCDSQRWAQDTTLHARLAAVRGTAVRAAVLACALDANPDSRCLRQEELGLMHYDVIAGCHPLHDPLGFRRRPVAQLLAVAGVGGGGAGGVGGGSNAVAGPRFGADAEGEESGCVLYVRLWVVVGQCGHARLVPCCSERLCWDSSTRG